MGNWFHFLQMNHVLLVAGLLLGATAGGVAGWMLGN